MIINLSNYPKIETRNKNKFAGELTYGLVYENSFLVEKEKSVIFPPKSKLNFWSYLDNLAKKNKGKMVELIFFGLNYNAKRIKYHKKPYVLDLQKSHKILVDEPRISKVKTKIFKRRIVFWSYETNKLVELVAKLKKQRKKNSYSGHGLIERDETYKIKPGKIRQK